MTNVQPSRDINDIAEQIGEYVAAGGTLAGIYGLAEEDLEPLYGLAYNLYNQGRWTEALRAFSFLSLSRPPGAALSTSAVPPASRC